MGSLMVIHGLSQDCVHITTTVLKQSLNCLLVHAALMVFQLTSVETMVLKTYLWLLGWKSILVEDLIYGGGKKTHTRCP